LKRILLLLSLILPPYTLVAWILVLLVTKTFNWYVIAASAAFYSAAIICSVVWLVICVKKNLSAKEALRMNMFVKLMHIPAYLVIFLFGVGFVASFFAAPFAVVLLVSNCLTILSSGLIGAGAMHRALKEDMLPKYAAIILGILQFMFCVDVISCVAAYVWVCRKSGKTAAEIAG